MALKKNARIQTNDANVNDSVIRVGNHLAYSILNSQICKIFIYFVGISCSNIIMSEHAVFSPFAQNVATSAQNKNYPNNIFW